MSVRKLIDIGANLTDSMYHGLYHGSQKHEGDLRDVLDRGWKQGLERIIITGGSLSESAKAIKMAREDERLYCTVGCHPTRCGEFEEEGDPDSYLKKLDGLVKEGRDKVVAIGECGLDYDRLQFCSKELQLKYFERQLKLSETWRLPLFLHCRNAASDLLEILEHHRELSGGVVHSFDGSSSEAARFLDLGYYIGLNGCSLKTQSNLDVVKDLPADRLLLETDCPWCEVKQTHAGWKYVISKFPSVKKEKWQKGLMVKGRNEPANIVQVLEVVAGIRGEDPNDLASIIHKNTVKLFFSKTICPS